VSQPKYSERFDDAMNLTMQAFRCKDRKGSGVPYIMHLLAVCAMVGEHGGDEDQIIAALLHDYLEDVPEASAEELSARFGERVARFVVALSDTMVFPKPPWKKRKVAYLAGLGSKPVEIKLISAADKVHNCRSILQDHKLIGDAIFDRFNPEKAETIWYYEQCVQALSENWQHPLLDELSKAVAELSALR